MAKKLNIDNHIASKKRKRKGLTLKEKRGKWPGKVKGAVAQ